MTNSIAEAGTVLVSVLVPELFVDVAVVTGVEGTEDVPGAVVAVTFSCWFSSCGALATLSFIGAGTLCCETEELPSASVFSPGKISVQSKKSELCSETA